MLGKFELNYTQKGPPREMHHTSHENMGKVCEPTAESVSTTHDDKRTRCEASIGGGEETDGGKSGGGIGGEDGEEEEEGYRRAEEHMRSTIAKMHTVEPSRALYRYLKTLEDESRTWNEDTLHTGMRQFTAVVGHERAEYFENPWSGLHYPTKIDELWSQTYPCWSYATNSVTSGWVCPLTWSYTFENSTATLTYCGSGPYSQALNELIIGPTALDCGMWTQVAFGFGMRYMMGDGLFDRVFDINKMQIKIVQSWNKAGPEGNLLSPFYDLWSYPGSRTRTRILYNHPSYPEKHPGGTGRLQNTIQIDDEYLIFDPSSACKTLSLEAVQWKFIEAYNKPRDAADAKTMEQWKLSPEYIHPSLAPNSWGEMYKRSITRASEKIDMTRLRRDQRVGQCLTFNFLRLVSCLEEVMSSRISVDVLRLAANKFREDAKRVVIPACKNSLTDLKQLDAVLTRLKGTQPEVAAILEPTRSVCAENLEKQLQRLEKVNARLAGLNCGLSALHTEDDENAEEDELPTF